MTEKTYTLVTSRLESKEIVVLELLDDESTPQTVLTTVHRISKSDFEALGKPAVGDKFKLVLEAVKAQ